jgi:FtsP/CotA-like multicopper oxidase with cupredoxin domain
MEKITDSRRRFLKGGGLAAGALLLPPGRALAEAIAMPQPDAVASRRDESGAAEYTIRIAASPIEIAPKIILSTITYNGQFPGPLIRFREGRQTTVDILNDTDTPEQLHWHGQKIPTDVDGAAEEGTPYVPAHGKRHITFTPNPAGFRFYHSHNRAGANLFAGTYTGQSGPVYIEPKNEAGHYDREIFLTLKEFGPTLSRGGDMAQDFLSPSAPDKALKETGEAAMKASLAKGMPHGYEVGYTYFTINGKMLGHGEPIRVKQGERVLFHILNASATEIRSLALPGHSFDVIGLDGNSVPKPARVPVLWLGTAERISAIVFALWETRRYGAPARRNLRYDFRQGQRRRCRFQSLDDQRRCFPDGGNVRQARLRHVSSAAGQALPRPHAQCERRYSSGPSAPSRF